MLRIKLFCVLMVLGLPGVYSFISFLNSFKDRLTVCKLILYKVVLKDGLKMKLQLKIPGLFNLSSGSRDQNLGCKERLVKCM